MNLDGKGWVLIVGQELELGAALQSDYGIKSVHRPVGKACPYLFSKRPVHHIQHLRPRQQ